MDSPKEACLIETKRFLEVGTLSLSPLGLGTAKGGRLVNVIQESDSDDEDEETKGDAISGEGSGLSNGQGSNGGCSLSGGLGFTTTEKKTVVGYLIDDKGPSREKTKKKRRKRKGSGDSGYNAVQGSRDGIISAAQREIGEEQGDSGDGNATVEDSNHHAFDDQLTKKSIDADSGFESFVFETGRHGCNEASASTSDAFLSRGSRDNGKVGPEANDGPGHDISATGFCNDKTKDELENGDALISPKFGKIPQASSTPVPGENSFSFSENRSSCSETEPSSKPKRRKKKRNRKCIDLAPAEGQEDNSGGLDEALEPGDISEIEESAPSHSSEEHQSKLSPIINETVADCEVAVTKLDAVTNTAVKLSRKAEKRKLRAQALSNLGAEDNNGSSPQSPSESLASIGSSPISSSVSLNDIRTKRCSESSTYSENGIKGILKHRSRTLSGESSCSDIFETKQRSGSSDGGGEKSSRINGSITPSLTSVTQSLESLSLASVPNSDCEGLESPSLGCWGSWGFSVPRKSVHFSSVVDRKRFRAGAPPQNVGKARRNSGGQAVKTRQKGQFENDMAKKRHLSEGDAGQGDNRPFYRGEAGQGDNQLLSHGDIAKNEDISSINDTNSSGDCGLMKDFGSSEDMFEMEIEDGEDEVYFGDGECVETVQTNFGPVVSADSGIGEDGCELVSKKYPTLSGSDVRDDQVKSNQDQAILTVQKKSKNKNRRLKNKGGHNDRKSLHMEWKHLDTNQFDDEFDEDQSDWHTVANQKLGKKSTDNGTVGERATGQTSKAKVSNRCHPSQNGHSNKTGATNKDSNKIDGNRNHLAVPVL